MQGFPAGFALTALANYLLAEGASAQAVGSFIALVGLPWSVQFIWGPFIDRYQHAAMGRCRPWVVASQLLAFAASLSLILIDNPLEKIGMLTGCFFLHSIFASLQDASVDAMAIDVTPISERGRVNAFMRGGMLMGSSLGALLMAYCVRIIGFTGAAIVQSLLLLLLTILTVFIRERTHDVLFSFRLKEYQIPLPASRQLPSIGLIFKELFSALFSTLSLRTFGVIALVYTCLSIFIRSLNVHLIQKLHWTDTYLSSISSSYVVVGAILVIFGGGILSDKLGAKKMLLFVMFIIGSYLLIFNLLSPLWNDRTFSTTGLLFWYMFDPSFSIAAMPLLMNICRKGIEGSQFTTYMSLVNFCDVAGAYLSGIILLWVSTPQIGVVCGLLLVSISLYLHYQAKVASTSPPLNS